MNIKSYILSIILIFTAIAAQSQFFVDVYYGYNHSNEAFEIPDANSYTAKKYYGNPVDTFYHWTEGMEDTAMIIDYNLLNMTREEHETKHDFYKHQLMGINVGYGFNKYIRLGFSYDYIGVNKFSFKRINDTYKYDTIERRYETNLEYSYYIHNLSLTFSFNYPLNRITPELIVGFNSSYSQIKHTIYDKSINYKDNYENTYPETVKKYSGLGYGLQTALGVNYNFYKNLSIFGRLGYSWGNLRFTQGVMTKYYSGGQNIEVDLPKELDEDEIPFYKIPYSGFNVRIGLRYTFGEAND
ncbi:MAG: hypothetical protein R6V32_09675 [Bacteroidales bacterium]